MMHMLGRRVLLGAIAGPIFGAVAAVHAQDAALEFFEKQVRPLLAENCYKCHGPETQKSGLRLDHISTALKGGARGPALVPGDPGKSHLVEFAGYGNVDIQMPPTGKLSAEKIATLTQWVAMGAPWPDEPAPAAASQPEAFDLAQRRDRHWAWQAVKPLSPPSTRYDNWSGDPVDRFIAAKLDEAGLEPGDGTDKYSLIRRAYFDITGLPPKPGDIEAFVADESPDAFATVIDRLLASPEYGERWARHWFDLVRYAETFGHEQDYPIRYAWKYRDYVIRALNADVPYDRLVTEHVAGDLIDNPRMHETEGYNESIIGTGFWFMHQATHGPVDVRQDEADRIDNQIDVIGKAFLGMTVACARCHDHKFDAIATKDYYALAGFMQSSRQQFAYLDRHGKIREGVAAMKPLFDEGERVLAGLLRDNADAVAAEVANYLPAVQETMRGEWIPSDGLAMLRPDIVFEDFERGDYANWTSSGTAFGRTPAAGVLPRQATVGGVQGTRFANSFEDGDLSQGKLVSRPFLIERRYIRFLIAGGNMPENAGLRLRVGGEIVRTATGDSTEAFRRDQWDVAEFGGQQGILEIADESPDEGGHVLVDHIVFSEHLFSNAPRRPFDAVAAERTLDPGKLARWVDALQDPGAAKPAHPFFAWSALAAVDPETWDSARAPLLAIPEESMDMAMAATSTYTVFEDFNSGVYDGWFPSGEAFGDAPAAPGEWLEHAVTGVPLTAGAAQSGRMSKKLRGVLRSPTFTIEHDNIHYRMAGEGGQIRLVIENFQLREYNGLLFESTLIDVNTGGQWVWHNQTRDLAKFKGRRAYIELIDDGDGYIAVDEIRFSGADPAESLDFGVLGRILTPDTRSTGDLVQAYAGLASSAMLQAAEGTANAGSLDFLQFLSKNALVDLDDPEGRIAQITTQAAEIDGTLPEPERVLAITDGSPEDENVFIRGSYKTPGDPAPRRFLEAIAGPDQPPIANGSGRLELANDIVDPANPLTARVMANRVWHHLFGKGIVPTLDNFGVLGQPPSHPELLDFLADRFQSGGWSIKRLIRELMLTKTYALSSAPGNELAEQKDPANVWLHRASLRRLEGESIRDTLLAVSGRLDPAFYGESVPAFLSPFMSSNRRPPTSGPMDGANRRSIYQEVRRNFLSPMMLAFDMPIPDTTVGRRNVSNVPAQALILMNDPFVAEQAKAWSELELQAAGLEPRERIDRLFMTAIARHPSDEESEDLHVFLIRQGSEYGLSIEECFDDPRVWADLCHVVFTMKEFIFIR